MQHASARACPGPGPGRAAVPCDQLPTMKDFLKYTLATLVGMLLFLAVTVAIGAMCFAALFSSDGATNGVDRNSVLVLDLSGTLQERSQEDFLDQFGTGNVEALGLEDILDAIRAAGDDDDVKGIYLKAGLVSPDSWATLQAIREALLGFRERGKWVLAYSDLYTQGTYYLASAADRILINAKGQLDWHGLSSQPIFLKDLLAKFGVRMQLAKVGTYKSMPERYTADRMSDANREQVTAYVTGIWDKVCSDVSQSRGISVDRLNEYADSLIMFNATEDYVRYGLVDSLVYADAVRDEMNRLLGQEAGNEVSTVGVEDLCGRAGGKKGGEVAVYYAWGDIVDSEEAGMLSRGGKIVAKRVCEDLEDLMDDDGVKAVVLRVNSGGGSAYASEQIWHQVQLLREKKPVVVSMGGMAASGGYYIGCGADWIVAEQTTLTGSIGIFGMFPDASELLTQKLGVRFDAVGTNRNSGFGTMSRPFNDEEMGYLTRYIERGYALFLSRVAEGRGMDVSQVDSVAQGRVWLGPDAAAIGLVDELGGLDAAVAKAVELAGLKGHHTRAYPGKKGWMESLMDAFSAEYRVAGAMRDALGEYYEPFRLLRTMSVQDAAQARMPFIVNLK